MWKFNKNNWLPIVINLVLMDYPVKSFSGTVLAVEYMNLGQECFLILLAFSRISVSYYICIRRPDVTRYCKRVISRMIDVR